MHIVFIRYQRRAVISLIGFPPWWKSFVPFPNLVATLPTMQLNRWCVVGDPCGDGEGGGVAEMMSSGNVRCHPAFAYLRRDGIRCFDARSRPSKELKRCSSVGCQPSARQEDVWEPSRRPAASCSVPIPLMILIGLIISQTRKTSSKSHLEQRARWHVSVKLN